MSGFDANGCAEYDRFIAGPLCRAIDSVSCPRSSNEASPLSGVLLTYGEQFFFVSATDGVRSATKKYGEGDEPSGAVKVVVPADLVDALATNFDYDEELRVELHSTDDDPVLHLEGDDYLMVQPLWPLNHYRDAIRGAAARDPTKTLVIRLPEFTQLLETVNGDEAISALTPERLIVRTAEGLIGGRWPPGARSSRSRMALSGGGVCGLTL